MTAPPVRIVLRPIGSPLTLGMSGLAVASLVESGVQLSWVAPSQTREVGLILIAVPFVLQLVACVFAYLARDGATGAAVGLLSGTWLALGLIRAVDGTSTTGGAVGLLLLMAGGTLALSAIAVSTLKPLPGVVFGLAAARFLLGGIYEMSGATAWRDAAGIMGLVIAVLAAYCVLAFELEGEWDKTLLPTLRVGRGRTAVSGDPESQVDGVTGAPGVRHTT